MDADARDAEDLDRLAQAFVERARRGESPSIDRIANEHPELAEDIRELFPMLEIFEGLKREEGAAIHGGAHGVPERVGAYELGRELGRGGMGTVYEARRVGDGDGPDRVAVKLVHPHLLDRADYVARFLQEADAGRRVTHANVVRTLETGVVGAGATEVPYILLEYVEGQDLRALLREVDVVPERLCRHVGARLADALAAVHAAGLVHRDVKPENVVITKDETVKLMDLGVAVVQDRLQRLSRTGEFVGSLLYASPGQVAGEDPDPGWDLHALGILLYELATGHHPARGAGLRWLRADESARGTLTHRDELGGVSPFLATVVETLLLAGDPSSFRSALELRDALQEGEASAWWKARRDASTLAHARRGHVVRPTAFYGRRREWQALDRALRDASEGRGRVVLLEGEAGIGKTRLVDEWTEAQRGTQTAPRVVVLPHAPGGAVSDEPQLATSLAEILGEDRLEERLTGLLASRTRMAAALSRRLRGEPPVSEGVAYDAAWMTLLQALGRERPVLLVAEDLHFAAAEDVDRFLYFARAAAHAPLLLVGTFRPQPEPRGIRELLMLEHVSHRTIDGLDTEACHDLLREASADTPQIGESVESLAERSDRNPMLLLELVRRARLRARADLGPDTSVPDSIRGFLLARISALEATHRDLLDAAACHGYEFDPVLVAEASGTGRVEALKRLGRIERTHGLLRAAGRHYRFQHHLVQEVLYAELHPALRESYHAALGRALEAHLDHPSGDDAATLCMHFLKGGEPLRAKSYVKQALFHLQEDRMAYIAAYEMASSALEVDGLLEGVVRAYALHLRASHDIAEEKLDEARSALEEADALAREVGDASQESDIAVALAWHAAHRDGTEAGLPYLERAAERAHAANDVEREAVALSRLALELVNLRRLDKADARIEQAFAVLGDSDNVFARCRLTSDLASLRIAQGRLSEAEDLLGEAGRLADQHGDLPTGILVAAERGRLAFRLGRFEDHQKHFVEALQLTRRTGYHHRDAFFLLGLGRSLVRLGRFADARQRFEDAVALARRREDRPGAAAGRVYAGTVQAATGGLADALHTMESAGLEEVAFPPDLFALVAVRYADLLARLGRFDDAHAVLDEACAACADGSVVIFEIRLLAARAEVHALQGRDREARALYAEVVTRAAEESMFSLYFVFGLACSLLRTGLADEAEAGLRESLAWGREQGIPTITVLAQVHLARLPGGDVLAARVALEKYADRLTAFERIEACYGLWEADGDEASLEAAWQEFQRLRAGAPAADRDAMLERVAPYRRVAEAWSRRAR